MVDDANEILTNEKLMDEIDYKNVDEILNKEKIKSLEWLKNALLSEKKVDIDYKSKLLVKYLNRVHQLEYENSKHKKNSREF